MKGVYPYEYFDSFEKFSETVLPPKSFLLLAVVFENFRGICLNYYKLDPAHFYTAPSLSWAACLKMTNVELQLITDIDMHLYLQAGLRGGLSVISNRYSKANNKYLEILDHMENQSISCTQMRITCMVMPCRNRCLQNNFVTAQFNLLAKKL